MSAEHLGDLIRKAAINKQRHQITGLQLRVSTYWQQHPVPNDDADPDLAAHLGDLRHGSTIDRRSRLDAYLMGGVRFGLKAYADRPGLRSYGLHRYS